MFERFTASARTAVIDAQKVARRTGTHRIDTRHILISLLNSDPKVYDAVGRAGAEPGRIVTLLMEDLSHSGLDAEALASVGIDLEAVRNRTDAIFGHGALDRASRTKGHLPFTPDAKESLELALREAIHDKTRRIESTHLLMGVVRAEGPGHDALVQAGVDPQQLRRVLATDTGRGSPTS